MMYGKRNLNQVFINNHHDNNRHYEFLKNKSIKSLLEADEQQRQGQPVGLEVYFYI